MGFKNYWEKYKKKKGIKGIIFDALFIILLVLIVVPASRAKIITGIVNTGIIQPGVEEDGEALKNQTWNWQFTSPDGTVHHLHEYKGKVILINFWATWCPPCIAELPSMQDLYDEFGEDMVFIFATNESISDVEPFIEKNGYSIPVMHYRYKVPEQLSSTSIPQTFVISKDGKIVLDKAGFAKWDGKKMTRQFEMLISQE